jgi:hypothetical protein
MIDIGKKNENLAKKIKVSDLLLNIPLNYAAYLPTVSPMLKNRMKRTKVQLPGKPSIVLLKVGAGKRVKVMAKETKMIQG